MEGHCVDAVDAHGEWAMYQNFAGKLREKFRELLPPPFTRPRSEGSIEVTSGGYADVSQGIYEGRRVAIKVVRVYVTSNLDVILSVSLLPTLLHLYE